MRIRLARGKYLTEGDYCCFLKNTFPIASLAIARARVAMNITSSSTSESSRVWIAVQSSSAISREQRRGSYLRLSGLGYQGQG